MSFRQELVRAGRRRRRRIVLAEGSDPRVRAAAARLRARSDRRADRTRRPRRRGCRGGPAAPVGWRNSFRSRRPDKIQDGVHALDIGATRSTSARHSWRSARRTARWPAPWSPRPRSSGRRSGPSAPRLAWAGELVVLHGARRDTCSRSPTAPWSRSPPPAQLAEIALAAARDRSRLVGDEPRVAFLSYSHQGQRGRADGRQGAGGRRSSSARRRRASPPTASCRCDAALDAEVGERKAPGSVLGGRANILIFPDLDAGNIGYKLVQRLAGAVALGPILQGLARPMADLSRGATVDDIVEVAAMVALQSEPTACGRPSDGFSQSKDSGVPVVRVEGQLIVGNRQELKELVQGALDRASGNSAGLLPHRLHRFVRAGRAGDHLAAGARSRRRAAASRGSTTIFAHCSSSPSSIRSSRSPRLPAQALSRLLVRPDVSPSPLCPPPSHPRERRTRRQRSLTLPSDVTCIEEAVALVTRYCFAGQPPEERTRFRLPGGALRGARQRHSPR